jgi:hypothetical protein
MASDHNKKKWIPEGSGVNPKPIITFLTILTVATVAVYIIIKVLLWGFGTVDEIVKTAPASKIETGQRRFPAEPRLQGAPEPDTANPANKDGKASLYPLDEMREYAKQIEAAETGHGWVEGKQGVEARISIDDAKKLMAQRGLPVKSEAVVQEVAAAEKVRKQLNNADASAGRNIGK